MHYPPSLSSHLVARLGPGSARDYAAHMFSLAFTATTLRRFRVYWNPLYGYALTYYCYAPLRRLAPRPVSLVLTFAASGFLLHDGLLWPYFLLSGENPPFPVVTVAFIAIALAILAGERLGLTLAGLSPAARVASHLSVIAGAFAVSIATAALLNRHAG